MRLKLKESPREWQKFAAVMCVFPTALGLFLARKGWMPKEGLIAFGCAIALILLAAWLKPGWFRGFYRTGMTASFHVGQCVGWVMLTLLFLLLVTPMGWILRLAGKDLLQLRRDPQARTYWNKPRDSGSLDSMY